MKYIPERGDLVWLQFDPQAGHEQSGKRPAVILSPAEYNGKTGLALCCPVTSQIKGYPFEVELTETKKIKGTILSDQVKSLNWRHRKAAFIEKIPAPVMAEILGKIGALLGVEG